MTQDEFDDLIQEIREEDPEQLESEFFIRDKPLKEDKLAKLEQKAGFTLPEEYRACDVGRDDKAAHDLEPRRSLATKNLVELSVEG